MAEKREEREADGLGEGGVFFLLESDERNVALGGEAGDAAREINPADGKNALKSRRRRADGDKDLPARV